MHALIKVYSYLFKEIADDRVYSWPLMADPLGISLILLCYFYAIAVVLPLYMENKRPYKLKLYIALYNIFQIVSCCVLNYRLLTSGWLTHYTLGCQLIDYSENEIALRMASTMWYTFALKIIELTETAVFIIRKKNNQVSFLHIYHHSSTVVIGWVLTKYFAGGMASFGPLLNNSVHVIMYTYYLFSSFGPKMDKYLKVVKNKITLIQIIQLFLILIYISQAFSSRCNISNALPYITFGIVSIDILFFFNYYMQNFIIKKKAV